MEDAGIEPATSRMQSERSATELNPQVVLCTSLLVFGCLTSDIGYLVLDEINK